MIDLKNKQSIVRLLASEQSWIEGDAIRQLQKTAELEGMKAAVGLPDLHPGRGNPVGAAFFSVGRIYPHLVGNDVGCGIGLWQTSLKTRKVKRDKWSKKLKNLENPWDGDRHDWLLRHGLKSSDYDMAHGTIGAGNHFMELQMVEKIHCKDTFNDLGLDQKIFYLLVHSGSRGIGDSLLRRHTNEFGAGALVEGSEKCRQYLDGHALALKWAKASRSLMALRFSEQLNASCDAVLDVCHNRIERVDWDGKVGWLHRKGAAASDTGPIVIPGSRGALSYLVLPVGDQKLNLWSLAHGAGRKWNRKSCRDKLKPGTKATALRQTDLGSVVICDDKAMLFEEAPQAYKKIETVIDDMRGQGLIRVVATLRPLITYKTRTNK